MRLVPFNFTCLRDWNSTDLLVRSWKRFYPERWTIYFDPVQELTPAMRAAAEARGSIVRRQSRPNFGQWCWDSSMCKLDGWRDMASDPTLSDDDYLLYADSDAMFHTGQLLRVLGGDFMGFPHSHTYPVPSLNTDHWTFFSGALQIGRVGAVRRMSALTKERLDGFRKEMLELGFSHNEDVVISFLMAQVGAEYRPLPFGGEPDPEAVLRGTKTDALPFSHMSGGFTRFLGIEIAAKWEIPIAIEKAGIVV